MAHAPAWIYRSQFLASNAQRPPILTWKLLKPPSHSGALFSRRKHSSMSFARQSLVTRNWWDEFDVPSRLRDQHFGLGLSDLDLDSSSSFYRGYYLRPRRQLSTGGTSEVKADPEKFQVRLDVGHFAPEEITVKTVDDSVVVSASHEEKLDEHGLVSRHFTRRYALPEGVEPEAVTSALSPDGILTVEAPRRRPQPALASNERTIPVKVLAEPHHQQQQHRQTATTIPVTREKGSSEK